MQCCAVQLDAQSRARAWFGAAVAMHMQQEHDAAIHTFGKAAEAAQTGAWRGQAAAGQAQQWHAEAGGWCGLGVERERAPIHAWLRR